MLGPEGQRRALRGLGESEDSVVLLHGRGTILATLSVDRGYPCLDDRDAGNPGKGEFVVTWRVTLPEGRVLGNAVERVHVVSKAGEVVVDEEFPRPVVKDPAKTLLVYVNHHFVKG